MQVIDKRSNFSIPYSLFPIFVHLSPYCKIGLMTLSIDRKIKINGFYVALVIAFVFCLLMAWIIGTTPGISPNAIKYAYIYCTIQFVMLAVGFYFSLSSNQRSFMMDFNLKKGSMRSIAFSLQQDFSFDDIHSMDLISAHKSKHTAAPKVHLLMVKFTRMKLARKVEIRNEKDLEIAEKMVQNFQKYTSL